MWNRKNKDGFTGPEMAAAQRMGVAPAEYVEMRAQGKHWCSYRKHWCERDAFRVSVFRGLESKCIECHREYNLIQMHARRTPRSDRGMTYGRASSATT